MKKVIPAILLATTLSSANAIAAEPAGYIFGGLGKASYDVDGESDSATSFALGGGYTFNENFAVEVRFDDFGELEESFSENGYSQTASFSASALALSLKAGIPAGETFFLYARVGLSLWDVEASFTETFAGDSFTGSVGTDGNDLHFGFGAEFAASEAISIGADYTMLSMELDDDEIDVNNLSLSVSYKF